MSTSDQFRDAERMADKAFRAARMFNLDASERAAINLAACILGEARFFAMQWEEVRNSEDGGAIDAETARKHRQELIQRLTSYCAPTRL